MKLYHGSRYNLEKIQNKQATKPKDLNGIPDKELQDGIYLSPDYGFALAMASRPNGISHIEDSNKTITFEKPELFNPDNEVFIYTFDSEKIPTENLEYIDKLQYVVTGENELIPIQKENLQARELLKYYKITNWSENKEITTESKIKFK